MTGASWHARIECRGRVAGAGFLVGPRTVPTCAHLVHHSEPGTSARSAPPG
ncbi:hypothetical protein [Streptomyces sp. NBC_00557]|uniref:hypothetical protein n=1 Tax=Streptomyces sp. NBC_00557 TaxID=2975776 RepID=UPI002E80BA5D|nr:hypothetical protein [Streptomyces sp. NBC_00557]WUC40127.1 hypothetical protein OG956_25410 [Streptomyces sp. NBC_00557]